MERDKDQTKAVGSETIPAVESETEKTPPAAPGKAKALDPTRYGDWERNGRCIDF
jgi:hypothetical protein